MPLEQIVLMVGVLLVGVVVSTTIGSLIGRRFRIMRNRRANGRNPATPPLSATPPGATSPAPAAAAPGIAATGDHDRRRVGLVVATLAGIFVIGTVGGVGMGAVVDWLLHRPAGIVAPATGFPEAGVASASPTGGPDGSGPVASASGSDGLESVLSSSSPGATPGSTPAPGVTEPGATPGSTPVLTPGGTPLPTIRPTPTVVPPTPTLGPPPSNLPSDPPATPTAMPTGTPTITPTPTPAPTPTPDPTPTPPPTPTPAPTPVPPSVDFDYTVDGLTVSFANRTKNAVTWSWSFGDGAGSSARNPAHTYDEPGTYTVILTATSSEGGTDSVGRSVTVP